MYLLEICADGLANALLASKHGAHRIELCENLESGGLTPSFGTLSLAANSLDVPVHVLIRPRRGNYTYDSLEKQIILNDIARVVRLGFQGVVVGALRADGTLDEHAMKLFVEAADGLNITFHRALDVCKEPEKTIEQLIRLGVERVLTSGGASSAMHGMENLTRWQQLLGDQIKIMAGGGIRASNAAHIIRQSGVSEIHMSAKMVVSSPVGTNSPLAVASADEWWQYALDIEEVAATRHLLDELNNYTLNKKL
ncbi:MAG: copper homeostasis protein CutC [Bacteroidetes bacterium]|nr:copper homeostasis protein CutC [Bacteroidota bacterium]